MRYIIMCGGSYVRWQTPKHLTKIQDEPIVARTIRLLKEAGVKEKDIAISSNNPIFEQFGVKVLNHENKYQLDWNEAHGDWLDAFYPTDKPVCYIFGDVVFSPRAIKTIVETETDSIQFFASSPPFAPNYFKPYAEPFAFKVVDTKKFFECIEKTKQYDKEGKFGRQPVSWELWQVINGTQFNHIDFKSYKAINDYTCDIDTPDEAPKFEEAMQTRKVKYLIHSCESRQWYVEKFIIPSMLEQGIKEEDIYNYVDTAKDGNLLAFIKSCKKALEMWGEDASVWHIQDDVLLSKRFKEVSEMNFDKYSVVCGFTCFYDDGREAGEYPIKDNIWYSFPCVLIKNRILKPFVNWVDTFVWRDPQFGVWVRKKKGDDFIFRVYIESYHPKELCLNLAPNLVEHVDYLLGGSTVNMQRTMNARSQYWDENDLVEKLQEEISKI